MSFSLRGIRTTATDDFDSGLGHAESILDVRRLVNTPGISGSAFGSQLRELLPEDDEFLNARWRTAARSISDFLKGRRTEVVGETRTWLPIKMFSLRRPQADGAKATLSLTDSKETSAAAHIEIFGIGGGPEFTVEIGTTDSLETKKEDVDVSYWREVRWEICRMHTKNGSTDNFARMVELLPAERVEVAAALQTGLPKVTGEPEITFDLRQLRGTFTRSLKTHRGVRWSGKAGLKLEKFGIELSVEYGVTRKVETAYEYTLPGGYMYDVVRVISPDDWCWRCGK